MVTLSQNATKIGDRLRNLRKARGLTLQELSKTTGVAIGSLSRIENNKMTGTIQSHAALCETLGIALPDLYKEVDIDTENLVEAMTCQESVEVYVHNAASSSILLTSNVLSKKMMPYLLKIQTGGKTQPEENKLGTEKFYYVLKGPLEITVGNTSHRLNTGDSFYFKSSQPHWLANSGNEEVSCLCIVTPSTL